MKDNFCINWSALAASLVIITIPFMYNACLPGEGFETVQDLSSTQFCSSLKAQLPPTQKTSVFASKKVFLGSQLNSQFQKVGDQEYVYQQQKLVAYLDTYCALEKLNGPDDKFSSNSFLRSLIGSGQINAELKKQAFHYSVPNDISLTELINLADTENCLLSITPHRTYKPASTQDTYNDPDRILQAHHTDIGTYNSLSSFFDLQNDIAQFPSIYKPVVVAVVDSGVAFTHSDLANKMWTSDQGHHGVNATTLGSSSVDNNPFDISPISHGTHIAGLIAAEIDNNTGGHGVAPFGVEIMAVRIFANDNGNVTASLVDLVNGINWAVQNGADVINLSLGITIEDAADQVFYDPLLKEAIRAASQDQNRVIVTAAGNGSNLYPVQQLTSDGFGVLPGKYAAEYQGVINVGSYDLIDGAYSSFSHWGNQFVEIAAPGSVDSSEGLYSTAIPASQGADSYTKLQGTSQAAPMVAAAAAMAVSSIRSKYSLYPSAAEVERLVIESSTNSTQLLNSVKDGKRLNLQSLASLIDQDYGANQHVADFACY